MDEATAAQIAAIGDTINPDNAGASARLFAPQHGDPTAGLTLTRDVEYGEHDRHRLDLFHPPTGMPGRPVLVYVHGGNWVAGARSTPQSPFYENVGAWAARHGALGVTMSYRLVPEATYPAGQEDVASVVRWLGQHAAEHGGDPLRIVLMGSSAGAINIASYVAHERIAHDGVVGVVLQSALYDLTAFSNTEILTRYYGDTNLRAASPLDGLVSSGVPICSVLSELDPPDYHHQSTLLANAHQAAHGRVPHQVYLPEHNHFSSVLHLGTDHDQVLSHHLSTFLRRVTS